MIDHNFGSFDDFGVKNDPKVSHNMILMSKYKGQHGGKKGQKIRARPSPPPFRAMPERNRFILCEVFPKGKRGASLSLSISSQPGWKDAPICATLVSR